MITIWLCVFIWAAKITRLSKGKCRSRWQMKRHTFFCFSMHLICRTMNFQHRIEISFTTLIHRWTKQTIIRYWANTNTCTWYFIDESIVTWMVFFITSPAGKSSSKWFKCIKKNGATRIWIQNVRCRKLNGTFWRSRLTKCISYVLLFTSIRQTENRKSNKNNRTDE